MHVALHIPLWITLDHMLRIHTMHMIRPPESNDNNNNNNSLQIYRYPDI